MFEPKPGIDPKYATFNRRMIASTIDTFLIALVAPFMEQLFDYVYPPVPLDMTALVIKLNEEPDKHAAVQSFLHALTSSGFLLRWTVDSFWQCAILAIFTGLCWRQWSATPGKMLLGMKIVDATTGEHISDAQILMRLWGYVVSTLGLFMGFFWISFDKRRQGWHDKMANTVVVLSKKSPLPRAGEVGFLSERSEL